MCRRINLQFVIGASERVELHWRYTEVGSPDAFFPSSHGPKSLPQSYDSTASVCTKSVLQYDAEIKGIWCEDHHVSNEETDATRRINTHDNVYSSMSLDSKEFERPLEVTNTKALLQRVSGWVLAEFNTC